MLTPYVPHLNLELSVGSRDAVSPNSSKERLMLAEIAMLCLVVTSPAIILIILAILPV